MELVGAIFIFSNHERGNQELGSGIFHESEIERDSLILHMWEGLDPAMMNNL
jgi:hypothetical protein